ncbi:MAG: 6,7-dimethyl-8-ribityllumazine synthase [Phycisphaerae bacterium]|nr:6,7-dimethyl-8-ribityllumazine synthase [Phycisphaerae bacterium]
MTSTIEGRLSPPPSGQLALVASRFNKFISDRLVAGALEEMARLGMDPASADVVWVPGSFEIPMVARRLAESGKYQAVCCLGAVIRGQTDHYQYVAGEAAKGVAQVGLATGVPTIFGIITADSLEQAIDRAGGKVGNAGAKAVASAVEMISVLGQVDSLSAKSRGPKR